MTGLSLQLPADLVEAIAYRVAELLREREPGVPDYLTPQEAADYMRCSKQRVYDLTSDGRLRARKDGSRSVYRRVDLDVYLGAEATS
jgi:excisionase family DNA binding protein